LSSSVFAEIETTTTYGTPYSSPDMNLAGMGAFSPGFVLGSGMGGGPSPADMAAKDKAVQDQKKKYCEDNGYPANVPFCAAFKKEKECNTVKSGAPIDRKVCIEDVGYRGSILTSSQCGNTSPTRTSGTFSWDYTFQGKFYGFKANIPAQSYDEFSWYSDQLACEKIISNAVTHIQANCDTRADYAIHEKCN
jgi:hypothetical protein